MGCDEVPLVFLHDRAHILGIEAEGTSIRLRAGCSNGMVVALVPAEAEDAGDPPAFQVTTLQRGIDPSQVLCGNWLGRHWRFENHHVPNPGRGDQRVAHQRSRPVGDQWGWFLNQNTTTISRFFATAPHVSGNPASRSGFKSGVS